jgi:histidinol phosphatase-like PHP family hydrolase
MSGKSFSMNSSTTNLVLASEAAIDLHLHTTYSDGSWTPAQLLDYLAREQVGLAAITDHDRVATVVALQQLAQTPAPARGRRNDHAVERRNVGER